MKDFYSFAPHSLLISDLTLKSTDKYCPDLLFCLPLSVCLHSCLSNLTLQRYTCTMNNNRKKNTHLSSNFYYYLLFYLLIPKASRKDSKNVIK